MLKQTAEYQYAAGAIFQRLRVACHIMSGDRLARYLVKTHAIEARRSDDLIRWINNIEGSWSAVSKRIHEMHRDSELLQAWRTAEIPILAKEADRLQAAAVQIRGTIFIKKLRELDVELRPQLERAIEKYYSDHKETGASSSFQIAAENSSDEKFREMLNAYITEHARAC